MAASMWANFQLTSANYVEHCGLLRHFDNLPTLSNGYFGMFTVAYISPWWFKVMDARLLAAARH